MWTARSIRVDFCLFARFLLLAATTLSNVCLFSVQTRTSNNRMPLSKRERSHSIFYESMNGCRWLHASASDKNIDLWLLFFLLSRLSLARIKIMARFTWDASSAYCSIEFSFRWVATSNSPWMWAQQLQWKFICFHFENWYKLINVENRDVPLRCQQICNLYARASNEEQNKKCVNSA